MVEGGIEEEEEDLVQQSGDCDEWGEKKAVGYRSGLVRCSNGKTEWAHW